MKISRNDWQRYTAMLARLNGRAADQMQTWMDRHPAAAKEQIAAMAFALATKYGEASAALACDMYDEIAAAQGARVPAAEPAETATYGETAKAVYGTMKNGQSAVPATTGRLVKQAGADTMLQNAARDGAEFAWIPMGDTCAFCLTLASRGWQRQSKKARDRHASHIHANCDCEYCVRFDGKSTVQGYDPDKYLEMYENAEGSTPQEKINAMRRQHYAENAPTIRAQKRAAYARNHEYISVLEKYHQTATPGVGKKKTSEGRKPKNREVENMDLIHREFGGDISMPAENNTPGVHNPDYIWRGKAWEEQEPIAHSRNAVDANVREAIRQIADNPGGIVLDVGDSNMPSEEINEVVLKRLRRSSPYDCDVIVIRNGIIEDIYHYRKIKK